MCKIRTVRTRGVTVHKVINVLLHQAFLDSQSLGEAEVKIFH